MKFLFAAVLFVSCFLLPPSANAECWYGMQTMRYYYIKGPKCADGIRHDYYFNGICTHCSKNECVNVEDFEKCVDTTTSAKPIYGCSVHAVTSNKCAQCDAGKTWNGTYCVCPNGQYDPNGKIKGGRNTTTCQSCSGGFKVSSAVCTACKGYEVAVVMKEKIGGTISYTAEQKKIREHIEKYGTYCTAWTCKAGYYKTNQDNGYCQPCPTIANGTCTACSNGTTCTAATCNSGYAWNGSSCARLNCAAGQYLSGNSCVSCPSGQWSAGGTATGCQPCSSLSVANGKCTACSASGSCTSVSCNGGYKASGASCVQVSCPAGQRVNGNACAACPSGQWSAGGTATACQSCSSVSVANGTCTACSTTGVCSAISCDRKYVFRNGACALQKCFSNTYEDASGNCRPCSDIAVNGGVCASCSYDGTVCESVACNEGWANDTAASCTPTKQCAEGGFWDESSQSCKRCDTYMVPNGGCVACNASGCTKAECDKANMTFSEADQKCGVECEPNQYLDASFTCKACPSGQYSVGGRASEATTCTSCSTIEVEGGTCVECSNGECTKASCSTGYRLDDTGKKCLKNAANCMDGLSVTADGCCCVK